MLLIATAIGGFGSLPVEPTVYTFTCRGIHRDGTIGIRGTCTCRGLHRPSTISVCYTCTCGDVHRAGIISERFTFAYCGARRAFQAVSYAEEFYESSSHVRRRLLATRCGEQCSPVSLSLSIPFIFVTRCR